MAWTLAIAPVFRWYLACLVAPLLVSIVLLDCAAAASSGVLYSTFRGESSHPINNVMAFSLDGTVLQDSLLHNVPADVELDELRSMWVDEQDVLWVASAHKSTSEILRFAPADESGRRAFLQTWASLSASDPGLVHPYKILLSDDGNQVLVSAQDSAVVLRFDRSGVLLPVSEYLTQRFSEVVFSPGTFVGPDSFVPASQGGLSSPRGLAFCRNNTIVFVADDRGGAVLMYDAAAGTFRGVLWTDPDDVPVSLHASPSSEELFVSLETSGRIIAIDLLSRKVSQVLEGLDSPAGIALGCDGTMFVANRKAKSIVSTTIGSDSMSVLVDNLPDEPEQLWILC